MHSGVWRSLSLCLLFVLMVGITDVLGMGVSVERRHHKTHRWVDKRKPDLSRYHSADGLIKQFQSPRELSSRDSYHK